MPIHGYPGGVITANPVAPTVTSASGVWTTEQQLQNQVAGRWPPPYYLINRSLRFNSADSAYLNRTPGSAGNRKTWTWSAWFKKTRIGSTEYIFTSGDSGVSLLRSFLYFGSGNEILFIDVDASNTVLANVSSPAVFRDPSAWYHIVLALDTTQATGSNRIKLYINGVQQTLTFSTTPSQNADLAMNAASRMAIGTDYSNSAYMSGYMTEINFINGQALTPSSFGQTNTSTGVWEPIAYSGTYGTNGFYLNFSDNSNTTAATLGKDYSGNGNNWTPNNFSVTAGAGNDSLVDTPTSYGTDTGVGGEVRGNYATLNPLDVGGTVTLSNGNLNAVGAATRYCNVRATTSVASGKWYWEVVTTTQNSDNPMVGIFEPQTSISANEFTSTSTGWGMCCGTGTNNGRTFNNGVSSASYTTFAANDVCMIALDMDNQKIWWGKNGTWLNSGNPVTGTNAMYSSLGTNPKSPTILVNTSGTALNINFGQRAFAYTAPSGFKALCTQNLPTPTIGATSTTQANDYFNPVLYTGNGTTNNITVGFQPDFVWFKLRSAVENHNLRDAVRGSDKYLRSDQTNAEATASNVSFTSDGLSLSGTSPEINVSSGSYVVWNWNAGGSNATNTAGTITSTVRANTTSGFSIVTYTGTGANATVGHGLGVAPSMVIVKSRSYSPSAWRMYNSNLANAATTLDLNSTAAADGTNGTSFNSTAPTSTVFSLGTADNTNRSGSTYVAYCFAPVAGYSAFGSYTGNGSTDGPFVYTGMRPAFILWKRSDGAESWWINDTDRLGYNGDNRALFPNLSNAENTANNLDILSNGFKIRGSGGEVNASGGTYIYACFAENPFKYSLAR